MSASVDHHNVLARMDEGLETAKLQCHSHDVEELRNALTINAMTTTERARDAHGQIGNHWAVEEYHKVMSTK